MKIHIEGMGIQGCFLALELSRRNIPFTWNDKEVEHTAWKACTGAVYPGGPDDMIGRISFKLLSSFWPPEILHNCVEEADYWFNHKKPPHEGKYKIIEDIGPMRRAEAVSYHLNGQKFVQMTRNFLAEFRTGECTDPDVLKIVSHGFSKRNKGAYWGWTVPVQITAPKLEGKNRPAVYLRKGKFVMVYFYPIPGTQMWYAGSSIIYQTKLKELDITSKFARFLGYAQELSGGVIEKVRPMEKPLQGWRPKCADDVDNFIREGNTIYMRPLWNNGVRHAGTYVHLVVQEIERSWCS